MKKRPLPPLKSLVALEAVVRHGSVTTAAAELCVTHGAISKHLTGLEDWLGLTLFSDKRRRMVPTDAAVTLAEGVGAALAAIGSALDAVRPPARSADETADAFFQVIAPVTFAMHWLVPRLPDLKRSGLTPRTRVRPTHTPENWRELTWDLAIRSGDGPFPTELTAVPLFRDTLGLLAAPALRYVLDRCDLRRLPYLESETRPGELDAWLAAAGLTRSEIAAVEIFEHNYIAIEAALSGQGAVVAPLAVVAGQIERGTLVRLVPEVVAPGPLFTALFDSHKASEHHARSVIGWLKKQIGSQLVRAAA